MSPLFEASIWIFTLVTGTEELDRGVGVLAARVRGNNVSILIIH